MKDDINKALEVLKGGGIILYPTDTIWGLGCDSGNDEAVKRIFSIKKREDKRQMLILVSNVSEIKSYVTNPPEIAIDLMLAARRPLSVVFQNAKNLAPSLIGDDKTIGIRVVQDEFCRELIKEFGQPIVSTSANISGNPPPQNFTHIDEAVKKPVDYIVEWRQDDLSESPPSEIISFGSDGEIIKIR